MTTRDRLREEITRTRDRVIVPFARLSLADARRLDALVAALSALTPDDWTRLEIEVAEWVPDLKAKIPPIRAALAAITTPDAR